MKRASWWRPSPPLPSLRAVLAGGAAVAALGGVLTACDGGNGERTGTSSGSDGRGGQEAVAVKRESLEVVTTVPATVRAATTVEVTAPGAGTVERISGRGVTILLDEAKATAKGEVKRGGGGGKRVRLDFPEQLRVTDKLVAEGRAVPVNYPLARGRIEGFAMVAQLDRRSLYKVYDPPLSARAQIDEGPGPFDCPLANTVPGGAFEQPEDADTAGDTGDADGPGGSADSGMRLVCVVPSDAQVFAGMSGVMAIRTASVKDALLLPVEAVAGDSSRGEVTVVGPDGGGETRTVELGATDGGRVQILSGVREGERVRVPAPNLAGAGGDGEEP